ncbi:MAG: alpha/beta hydrolase [Paracoccaceae bacterium]
MKWGQAGTLSIAGGALECASWGPAPNDAPTLVLLHEGLGCVKGWRDFPAALSEATGFGVFAYSRFGYGQSDPCVLPRPLDYMTREAVDVLPQVLDAIGFRRGLLVGHSDGATIAAEFGGAVPDQRVRGHILMAPHFFCEDVSITAIKAAKAAFETGDLRAGLAGLHKDPDMAFQGWCDAWLDPAFRDWNVGDAIDYLRVPVLAMQGADDAYGTRAQIDEVESRAYSPVETAWIKGCGHMMHKDQPGAVLDQISEFCARLELMEAASELT